MEILRVFGFYVAASAVLGSGGFTGWCLLGWLLFKRSFWSADIVSAWGLAILFTAAFLVLICTPLQLLAKRFNAASVVLTGLLSGPLLVWLLLILRGESLTARNYIYAPGVIQLHVPFAVIGILFALVFKHIYRGKTRHE